MLHTFLVEKNKIIRETMFLKLRLSFKLLQKTITDYGNDLYKCKDDIFYELKDSSKINLNLNEYPR